MKTDFFDEFEDPQVLLNEENCFQVTHGRYFSIVNMSDEELRQAIINDLLVITMWEKQFEKKLHYGMTRLMHFIPRAMHKRVMNQLTHDEIGGFIEITKVGTGSEIRIKDVHEVLQAAMDYCGAWYSGFKADEDAIFIDRDNLLEKFGSKEEAAASIAGLVIEEMMTNAPTTKTVN